MAKKTAPPLTVAERVEKQYDNLLTVSRADQFTETDFLASVGGFKVDMLTGTLVITLHVPANEKDAAWRLSDLHGKQLLVTVRRIRRRPSSNVVPIKEKTNDRS